MFWKKKDPCFHNWKTSNMLFDTSYMGDTDTMYEIMCTNCKKKRILNEYNYEKMNQSGFINK